MASRRQASRRFVRPTPPTNAQVSYLRALREVLGYARELINARLVPRLESLKPAQVERIFDSVDAAFWRWYTTERIRRIVEKEAVLVSGHNRAQVARQLGLDPSQVDVRRRTTVKKLRGDAADDLTPGGALRATIQQFTAENVALIKTLPAQYLSEVQQRVLQGMAKGLRHEEVADEVVERFAVARSRAALIARDQVNKFNGNLNKVRQENLGVESFIWRTAGDERVRDRHAEFNGKTYTWAEGTGEGDDPAVGDFPGQGVQCFPGSTRVSASALILKAYRHRHTGNLTTLVSEDLKAVRCTPNHPILTTRGWVAAQAVQVGDYVIHAPDEGADVLIPDLEDSNAEAVEVFSTLAALCPSKSMHTPSAGFHGDAPINEEIDIVDIDGGLRVERYSETFESLTQHVLALAYDPAARLGTAAQLFGRFARTSDCTVRGACQLLSLLGSHSNVAHEHRSAAVARLQASLCQAPAHYAPADIESFSHLLNAAAFSVEGTQRLVRQIYSVVRRVLDSARGSYSPGSEVQTEVVGADGQQLCGLLKAHAGYYLTRVVEKTCSEFFSGHVFNLETRSGWYSTDIGVVHNCRCFAEPVLDLEGDLEEEDTSAE